MQVYDKHAFESLVKRLSLTKRPPPTAPTTRVREEWIWQAVVQPARPAVREAPRQDFERRDSAGDEPPPELEVQERTPVCRALAWRRGCGHDVERLTEVWGVSVEAHERAVERIVFFVWMRRDEWGEIQRKCVCATNVP
jgi:hypothetical protein